MMDDAKDAAPFEIRGRIYPDSQTYAKCKSAPAKKAFKTLLGLAEEAYIVRDAVTRSTDCHPLRDSLSKMTSAEVVIYLMGLTGQFIYEQGRQVLQDGQARAQTMESAARNTALPVDNRVTEEATPTSSKTVVSPGELEMDDDMLESFASFPSK